jgi:hypothetical protein
MSTSRKTEYSQATPPLIVDHTPMTQQQFTEQIGRDILLAAEQIINEKHIRWTRSNYDPGVGYSMQNTIKYLGHDFTITLTSTGLIP